MRRLRNHRESVRTARALWLSLAVIACASCASCAGGPKGPVIEAKHVGTPSGLWFDEACTPTGPEICGNAIDDNCNGVIDEGCGILVSKVQFEVAWSEKTATVELSVSDPQGERLDALHPLTRSGLKLDKHCPQDGCDGQNVDNVVLVADTPLAGQYSVDVRLLDAGKASLPVKVHFGWRVGDRVSGTDLLLTAVDDKKMFSFEL